MNYIAASLLLQMIDDGIPVQEAEPQAFWVLVYILIEKQYRNVFKEGMLKALEMFDQIESQIELKAPLVYEHFKTYEVKTQNCFDFVIFSIMQQNCPKWLAIRGLDLFLLYGEGIRLKISLDVFLSLLVRLIRYRQQNILSNTTQEDLILYMRKDFLQIAQNDDLIYQIFQS